MNRVPDFSARTLRGFLAALGSQEAVPGGGAAAACVGALGASLVEMVARINDRRALKSGSQKALANFRPAARLRERLLVRMREDAAAFYGVSCFPKEKRSGPRYEAALARAARVPMQIADCAVGLAALAALEAPRTSRWLASDLREAALLLECAFRAAQLNVEINLGMMKDSGSVAAFRRKLRQAHQALGRHLRRVDRGLSS